MNATNVSEAETGLQSNSTHWQDTNLYPESQAALILWQAWSPCILFLGLFGNLATIFVMRRVSDNNSTQHVFLIALAVSDLSLLYTGLFVEWLQWSFHVDMRLWHPVMCTLLQWFVYSTNTTSAWLVTAVTVQRTMAVLWPHRMRVVCTVQRTWVAVAVVVLTAFLIHVHHLPGSEINEYNLCGFKRGGLYEYFISQIYTWLDMCLSSLLPAVCLMICNVVLSMTLFQASSSVSQHVSSKSSSAHGDDARRKTASKTTVMILAVSSTFLLLTMPSNAFIIGCNIACIDFTNNPRRLAVLQLLMTVFLLMWYSNSAVNFFLYCLTGTKFRGVFLSWFRCSVRFASSVDKTSAGS
ncbi:hypothetical protein ACOMHN_050736 [Nucella lapillus]